MPFSIPWMEVDSVWICVAHYLACLSPTIGSVVYHVFMNHVGGEHVYDTLLSLDMFGVCLVNTLGRDLQTHHNYYSCFLGPAYIIAKVFWDAFR